MLIFVLLFILFIHSSSNPELDTLIQTKELAVLEFAKEVENAFEYRCSLTDDCNCEYNACSSQFSTDGIQCNFDSQIDVCSCQGMVMDMKHSAVRIPADAADGVNGNPTDKSIKEMACFTKLLDPKFIELEKRYPDFEWQGFGGINGLFRIYPGRAQKTCGSYDPRIRNWYVTASSGPKDVVIILDRSGSMMDTVGVDSRWSLAVDACINTLKTLTISDHVNIVLFSAETYTDVITSDKTTLLRATKDNINTIKDLLLNYQDPKGGTNFEAGFKRAFDLLDSTRSAEISSKCQTVMIFLTDGVITEGAGESGLISLINERNKDIGAMIVSFALGVGSDTTVLKAIACQTDGIYQRILDEKNILSQMSLYYEVMAAGIAWDNTTRTTWVEPYNFATDGKLGTSVSTPVYARNVDPPLLLGVAGTGFSIESLQNVLIDEDDDFVLNELIARSSYCVANKLSFCQLQSLRNRYDSDSTCIEGDISSNQTWVNCGSFDDYNIQSCPLKSYPTNLWCNTAHITRRYSDRVCCNCNGAWITIVAVIGIGIVSYVSYFLY